MAITCWSQMGPDPLARIEALTQALGPHLIVQLREKQLPAKALMILGRQLQALCAQRGALLLINDRVDVARAIEGAGVHLPQNGLPPDRARALLGPGRWISAATHELSGLARKRSQGAQSVTYSPIFPSPKKGPPLGLAALHAAVKASGATPLFALGGVDATNIETVRNTGAHPAAIRAAWTTPPSALSAALGL